MSSAQLPSLNSFRRSGLRGRDRGGLKRIQTPRSRDEVIQNTDNDAASSRLSATQAGYLDDPFASLLLTGEVVRRLPLMNRGTFARTTAIDRIVDVFLRSIAGPKQIVSLGAGSDTRFFNLQRHRTGSDLFYHEIDFENNTRAKIQQLQSEAFKQALRRLCGLCADDFHVDGANLSSTNYYIHARDLRALDQGSVLPGLNTSLPTLILSECCLIYLSPNEATRVLDHFARLLDSSSMAIAIYEPIRPHDAFGRTMVQNLTARGIHLQTLEQYAELDDQSQRLRTFDMEAHAADIDHVWRHWIDDPERERVESLEWMDELEEFVLFGQHYCVSWGWRNFPDASLWLQLSSP